MRIIIRNCRSRLFLQDPGNWTVKANEARDFPDSMAAYDYCRAHSILRMNEIVFRFNNPRHDMVFKT